MKYFDMRLFFITIPKPLKQYTLFKKDYPFRSNICNTCVYNKITRPPELIRFHQVAVFALPVRVFFPGYL